MAQTATRQPNTERSSPRLMRIAQRALHDKTATIDEVRLAGSVLSQAAPSRKSSWFMAGIAGAVLARRSSSSRARELAACVLTQRPGKKKAG